MEVGIMRVELGYVWLSTRENPKFYGKEEGGLFWWEFPDPCMMLGVAFENTPKRHS